MSPPDRVRPWFSRAALAAALAAFGCGGNDASSTVAVPAAAPTHTTETAVPAAGARPVLASVPGESHGPTFVGSKSCVQCHAKFYDLWSTSHHGKAMQVFGGNLANGIAPQAEPISVGPHRYQAVIQGAESSVVETGPDGEKRYPILHALGGKNVYYFLTELERGKLQVLPVAYDVHKKTWYDTAASGMRHFENVRDDVREEAVHWKDREYTFNTSCHGCHVSQVQTNYDLGSDTYRTTWTEPGINCETCHGPASEHVKMMENVSTAELKDVRLFRMGKSATVEQNNAICASCHAKSQILSTSFQPGDRFFDHFGLVTLEHPDFYPDGRDLGENYTLTSWLMSPCAKGGELACLHCHTSSGRSRFTLEQANNACLPCHQDLVASSSAHSHHPTGSVGDRCTSCHMPTTRFAAMNRSDHSMLPPTPATTLAYKAPNACNLCHKDKDAKWADAQVREWYPDDYQKPVLERAALVEAARRQDWSKLPELLAYLRMPERDEVVANSLVRLLEPCPDPAKWPALVKTLEDRSPLVRASAVEALRPRPTGDVLARLLAATRDESRIVRIRAADVLAGLPPDQVPPAARPSLEGATAELEASLLSRPDDANAHANLANYHMNRGDAARAVAEYDISLAQFPRNYPALVNASLAYNAVGRNDRAEECLKVARQVNPDDAAAPFNLGLLLAEQQRVSEAEEALRAALHADPRFAPAAYNLAVLLAERAPGEALAWIRKAADLRPEEPRYRFTLAFYQERNGQRADAVATLERLLREHPSYIDAYLLLAEAHEQAGRSAAALDVYRRAAAQSGLTGEQRALIASKLHPGAASGPPLR